MVFRMTVWKRGKAIICIRVKVCCSLIFVRWELHLQCNQNKLCSTTKKFHRSITTNKNFIYLSDTTCCHDYLSLVVYVRRLISHAIFGKVFEKSFIRSFNSNWCALVDFSSGRFYVVFAITDRYLVNIIPATIFHLDWIQPMLRNTRNVCV